MIEKSAANRIVGNDTSPRASSASDNGSVEEVDGIKQRNVSSAVLLDAVSADIESHPIPSPTRKQKRKSLENGINPKESSEAPKTYVNLSASKSLATKFIRL